MAACLSVTILNDVNTLKTKYVTIKTRAYIIKYRSKTLKADSLLSVGHPSLTRLKHTT